ncbi:MAG: hypothetical protein AAF748_04955 [Pseudomonadota bacterium]
MRAFSMLPGVLTLFLCLLAPVRAQANFTMIEFCNTGQRPVLVTVYEHGGGIFSSAFSEGWYKLTRSSGCLKETISAYERRAYTFAALDEAGNLVALPFEFSGRSQWFSGQIDSICVPVQRDPERFTNAGRITPPCAVGWVALPVARNIRGGNMGETFTHNVAVPSRLPAPHPGYKAAWEAAFGKPDTKPPAPKPDTSSAGVFNLDAPVRPDGTCYASRSDGSCNGFGFPKKWVGIPKALYKIAEGNRRMAFVYAKNLNEAAEADFRNVGGLLLSPDDYLLARIRDDFVMKDRLSDREKAQMKDAAALLLQFFEDYK